MLSFWRYYFVRTNVSSIFAMEMKRIEVILPLPLEGTFTYLVPPALESQAMVGVRVLVPFGKTKTYIGVCATEPKEMTEAPQQLTANNRVMVDGKAINYKLIISVLDEQPIFLPAQLKLWYWISDYYMSPVGDVYKAALPSGLKAEESYKPKTETYVALHENYVNCPAALCHLLENMRQAKKQKEVLETYLWLAGLTQDEVEGAEKLTIAREITKEELLNEAHATTTIFKALFDKAILITYEKEVGRLNRNASADLVPLKRLSEVQAEAYNQILLQLMRQNVTLLHGVTSAGKTEIYIHLIQKTIDEKKQVLYLLPEIALTVQITERLRQIFGNRLGIYHSRYSDAERVEIWQKQLSNAPYDVILGARSAVFLPYQRLGLVIVDEEHEQSFKQQDPAPRYHARSVGVVLAQLSGAKTLLGTATPSVESYFNATQGKYGLVQLSTRYKGIQLPKVEVVDVKDLQRRKMMKGIFSPRLLAAVRESLNEGKQVILFQNRRGFSPMIECHTCGWTPKCPNCDVSLTYHKQMNFLSCHYCGHVLSMPQSCPNCEEKDLRNRGYGTEKIEDEIRQHFPAARIARMDLDTTRTKNAYERLIHDFSSGKTNLLIGTQMVSKGLDFANVAVVGILNADTMLNYPDFRSYEYAFTMMSQVSGRAGRKSGQGLVILQTKNSNIPLIKQVVNNDYTGFYQSLIEERALFHYPPYCRLIYVYLKHRKNDIVETAALEMSCRLRDVLGQRVLGPDKPAVARIKTLHIRKLMLKLENGIDLKLVKQHLRHIQNSMFATHRYGALQIYYDVDPC